MRSPARSAGWPAVRSSPASRRLSPRRSALAGKRTRSPSTLQNSCGTTVSSPAGITAPVMIRSASPAPTRPCQAAPASAVPTTRSCRSPSFPLSHSARPPAPHRRRQSRPSPSCRAAARRRATTTSSASTRPSASNSATSSRPPTTHGATSCARKACTPVDAERLRVVAGERGGDVGDAAHPMAPRRVVDPNAPAAARGNSWGTAGLQRLQLGQRVGVEEGVGRVACAVERAPCTQRCCAVQASILRPPAG